MRCDIIIPIWNQQQITKDCIDSILKNTDYPYRLILIDNGSGKETEEYLKGLAGRNDADIKLIRNDTNLGFVKAVNQGISLSDAPFICIMNNDTIAARGWLGEMINVLTSRPDIGLLNPSSNTSGQYPDSIFSIDDYAARLKSFKNEVQELYTCRGFCMLLRKEVIAKLGLLDEIYHLGYFDDTDYCRRAQKEGFRTARAKAAYVYHKENTTFKGLGDNKALFKKNETVFFERWGTHVRVGYFVDKIRSKDKINEIAIDVARSGHQILIFMKKGAAWPVKLDHFDIRRIDLKGMFFGLLSIYQILRRKRKKHIDILLTDNMLLGAFLKAIRALHGADVLVMPDKDRLSPLVKARAWDFKRGLDDVG